MSNSANVHVGVDVGGTNTDAVVLQGQSVVSWAKHVTTEDVTSGVAGSIRAALLKAKEKLDKGLRVERVHIGTTHFVNAVVQRKNLARVAVLRLCGPSTRCLPPFCDFPADLKEVLYDSEYMLDGGFEFDGQTLIRAVDRNQILDTIAKIKSRGTRHVVISGVFSPVNAQHEKEVDQIFDEHYPECSRTLSHEVGQLGLLERENASILNECLRPLCEQTVAALRTALHSLGLTCPFYLTQNDGTLMSAEQTLKLPVLSFASGPTNSMRGAAFLSGVDDAVVVDIGGTSTDVGVLIKGFPRQASYKVKVGKVRTNFRMPDVVSIGLGGGSLVSIGKKDGQPHARVGPDSVGYLLEREAVVYGGSSLTAFDVAVAAHLVEEAGDPQLLKQRGLSEDEVREVTSKMRSMVEEVIDQVKTSVGPVPVILVGGGSILLDQTIPLKGSSETQKPAYYQVANAVGAALSQVSGSVDVTQDLSLLSREVTVEQAQQCAIDAAVKAGADPDTVQVSDMTEVPLTYLPGNVTRLQVRAVGDLKDQDQAASDYALWTEEGASVLQEATPHDRGAQQASSTTGQSFCDDYDLDLDIQEVDPQVDPDTGEWTLSEWDVECIALGAGIMGCGGGGSPYMGKLRTLRQLKEGKTIRVITPERLGRQMSAGDCIVGTGAMGSPTICIERPDAEDEVTGPVTTMQSLFSVGQYKDGTLQNTEGVDIKTEDGITFIDDYKPVTKGASPVESGRRIVALFSVEAGGANCMAPLIAGAKLGLPVVDADCLGRAFPELQHMVPLIYGHSPHPACLSDKNGRRTVLLHADTPKQLENHFRKVCIEMGCGASFSCNSLGKEDLGVLVHHSTSRAWHLGSAIMHARKNKLSPIAGVLELEHGDLLCKGKVADVARQTTGGFARGQVKIIGFEEFAENTFIIEFQNENLVAQLIRPDGTKELLACTPDLISVVECHTGEPIPTEEVRYGLRVAVLAMAGTPLLRTPRALEVVGPQAFGYPLDEVAYSPTGDYIPHPPVPLQ